MNVSVNGVAVDVGRWPNPEVAAVRELLRQHAIARAPPCPAQREMKSVNPC